MAEVIGADHGTDDDTHRAGHEGIGLECPVSSFGVRAIAVVVSVLLVAYRWA